MNWQLAIGIFALGAASGASGLLVLGAVALRLQRRGAGFEMAPPRVSEIQFIPIRPNPTPVGGDSWTRFRGPSA